MTTTREPSFEQVMAHIDQVLEGETGDAEAARALALTDAEVLAELAEAGVDADAVRTMALEVLARHAPAAPAPSSLTEPLTAHGPDAPDASAPRLPDAHDGAPAPAEAVPQSSADRHVDRDEPPSVTNLRRLFPVAAVVLAIAAAIMLVVVLLPDQGIAPPHIARTYEPHPEPSPDERRADALRAQAFDACGASRWDECKGKLDEARALDPAGERAQPVREERAVLDRALAPPPPPAPPRPAPRGPPGEK